MSKDFEVTIKGCTYKASMKSWVVRQTIAYEVDQAHKALKDACRQAKGHDFEFELELRRVLKNVGSLLEQIEKKGS
jgi:hypothetical protein